MFKKILIVLGLPLAALAAVIAFRPDDFSVSRSATIAAPPDVVFDQVNDLHKWEAWSPWAKLDPSARNSFEGPAAGAGAIFRWDGNNDVGQGAMTIAQSDPPHRIAIKLEFIRPFPGVNDVVFTFKPQGDSTLVTWAMSGKNDLIAKAVGMVIDCEKMCGDMFEKGLASMKTVAEAAAKKP